MALPRSTFYDTAAVDLSDEAIVIGMIAICDAFETYGYRRVGAALRHQGFVVNGKKVRRLMRAHDLQPGVGGGTWRRPTAITTVRSSPIAHVTSC